MLCLVENIHKDQEQGTRKSKCRMRIHNKIGYVEVAKIKIFLSKKIDSAPNTLLKRQLTRGCTGSDHSLQINNFLEYVEWIEQIISADIQTT